MIADGRFFLNRRQALSRAIKGQIRLLELQKEHGWNRDTLITALLLLDDPYPIVLHFTAFMAVIEGQGTKEQIEEWIPQCERMEILGFPLPQVRKLIGRMLCPDRVDALKGRLLTR